MLLAAVAVMAPCLVLLAVAGQGMMAGFALLAVGLANSVMYPTIYVLALPGDPERAPAGGLILCIAVVGGAVVPMLTGWLADHVGLVLALLLPGTCYLPILGFALGVQSPSRELSRTINS
jgi:FHS family L-fucose permease-like MFS transporter